MFEPYFGISFNAEIEMLDLMTYFNEEFSSMIIWWSGWRGQTQEHYIHFHRDKDIDSGYQYILRVIGKLETYDAIAIEAFKEFARAILAFLEKHGCTVEFDAAFSLDT